MDELQAIYQRVAENFAFKINAVWESEDTMKAQFLHVFPPIKDLDGNPVQATEFSRTDHWNIIVYKMMEVSWLEAGPDVKSLPTGFDKLMILRALHPLLDYNLFTQVLLNLQGYTGMAYRVGDAKDELAKLKAGWKNPKIDPFASNAKKIKQAKTLDDKLFNNAISKVRAVNLISQFDGQTSFRVSPKGSTPAFADSRNLSMLGVGSDKYLKTLPNLKPFYIGWEPGTTPRVIVGADIVDSSHSGQPAGLIAEGITYPFYSKSGGEILNEVLFSRKVMYEIFRDFDITSETCIMIPRMNSVLVVTQVGGEHIKKTFERLKAENSVLELFEGARIKEQEDEVESVS